MSTRMPPHEEMLEKRREKAKELRYRRTALEALGGPFMGERLFQIQEACSDVMYYLKDDDALEEALGGDEETVYEFQMEMTAIIADADRIQHYMDDYMFDLDEYDLFTAGILGGGSMFNVVGYDDYEEDYFRLFDLDVTLAQQEAAKRLKRFTKDQLIEGMRKYWGAFLAFYELDSRYQNLEASISILRGQDHAFLEIVKHIEKLYDLSQTQFTYTREFDSLLAQLPDRVWVE